MARCAPAAALAAVAVLALSFCAPESEAQRGPDAARPEAQPRPADRVRARVRVVVLRSFPSAWVDPVLGELEAHLQVQAVLEPRRLPLPRAAYYPPRRRYRAERLLDFLATRFAEAPAADRILGLTSRDISTTKGRHYDWGILGLADAVPGRAAVVSSFRMRRRARSPQHALWRMTTTAVHEVGHTLGLEHCPEERCVMRDAEGTMDTVDAGDGELGASCRQRLDRLAPRNLARVP